MCWETTVPKALTAAMSQSALSLPRTFWGKSSPSEAHGRQLSSFGWSEIFKISEIFCGSGLPGILCLLCFDNNVVGFYFLVFVFIYAQCFVDFLFGFAPVDAHYRTSRYYDSGYRLDDVGGNGGVYVGLGCLAPDKHAGEGQGYG